MCATPSTAQRTQKSTHAKNVAKYLPYIACNILKKFMLIFVYIYLHFISYIITFRLLFIHVTMRKHAQQTHDTHMRHTHASHTQQIHSRWAVTAQFLEQLASRLFGQRIPHKSGQFSPRAASVAPISGRCLGAHVACLLCWLHTRRWRWWPWQRRHGGHANGHGRRRWRRWQLDGHERTGGARWPS